MDGPPFHVYNNRQTYSSYNSSPNRSPLGQRASAMSFPSNPRTADGSRWQSPHGDKRTGRSRGRSRLRRVAPSRSREDLRMGRAPRRKSAPRRQPPKRRRDDAAPESPARRRSAGAIREPHLPDRRHRRLGRRARGVQPALRACPPTPAWRSCSSSTSTRTHESLLPEILLASRRRCRSRGRATGMRGRARPRLRHPAGHRHDASTAAPAARRRAPTARGQHLPIDLFLRSLAEDQGSQAIGVVLSGTGIRRHLGLRGDQGRGRHHLRPGPSDPPSTTACRSSAIAAGCVDFVLPPRRSPASSRGSAATPTCGAGAAADAAERRRDGADAQHGSSRCCAARPASTSRSYKRDDLIRRRIARRMALHRLDDARGLRSTLCEQTPDEVAGAVPGLLINVTAFFRDPEAFEALQRERLPADRRGPRRGDEPVRVWVPGCSTGEEAYSLAIALLEFLERDAAAAADPDLRHRPQRRGRRARRAPGSTRRASRRRLARAAAPLLRQGGRPLPDQQGDPRHVRLRPARPDRATRRSRGSTSISCRNVLIYLEPGAAAAGDADLPLRAQAQRLPAARRLRERSVGSPTCSTVVDQKHRIYARSAAPRHACGFGAAQPRPARAARAPGRAASRAHGAARADSQTRGRPPPARPLRPGRRAGRTSDLEILQFRGETGAYLEPAPGSASLNLLQDGPRGPARRAARSRPPGGTERRRSARRGPARQRERRAIARASTSRSIPIAVRERRAAASSSSCLRGAPPAPPPAARPARGAGRLDATRRRRAAQIAQLTQELADDQRVPAGDHRGAGGGQRGAEVAPTRSCCRATRSCRASTRSWRPPRRSCSRPTRS